MLRHIRDIVHNEKGQGLVEYALILVLIAVVVMTAVKNVGTTAQTTFNTVNRNVGGTP